MTIDHDSVRMRDLLTSDADILPIFLDLCKRIKLDENVVVALDTDWDIAPHDREVPKEGWSLFANWDDFSLAFYKDGEPVAGMYASFRGVYQAAAYIVEGNQYLYARNWGTDTPQNVWLVASCSITAQCAYEWLLGKEE